jgi:hypothetical protein
VIDVYVSEEIRAAELPLSGGPAEWAAWITQPWQKSLESIIETGRRLIKVKAHISHGNKKSDPDAGWLRMFKGYPDAVACPVPFDESSARRLMKIAKNPILPNPAYAPVLSGLPWKDLYKLSQWSPGRLRAYVTRKKYIWWGTKRAVVDSMASETRSPQWSPGKAEKRLRDVVERELWRAPKGQEDVVEEILRRIADENEIARKQWAELTDVGRRWLQAPYVGSSSAPSYMRAKARLLEGRVIGQETHQVLADALQAQRDGWTPDEEMEAKYRHWSEARDADAEAPVDGPPPKPEPPAKAGVATADDPVKKRAEELGYTVVATRPRKHGTWYVLRRPTCSGFEEVRGYEPELLDYCRQKQRVEDVFREEVEVPA